MELASVRETFEAALAGTGRCYGCYGDDDVLGFLVVRTGGGPMEKVERRVQWFEDELKAAHEMGEAYARRSTGNEHVNEK